MVVERAGLTAGRALFSAGFAVLTRRRFVDLVSGHTQFFFFQRLYVGKLLTKYLSQFVYSLRLQKALVAGFYIGCVNARGAQQRSRDDAWINATVFEFIGSFNHAIDGLVVLV